MVVGPAGDVGGVVKESVAFGGDVGGLVLMEAFQAGAAEDGDVGAPFGAAQAPVVGDALTPSATRMRWA